MTADSNGRDLFIVDNVDTDWRFRRYLHDWANIARTFDIDTVSFENGALSSLKST